MNYLMRSLLQFFNNEDLNSMHYSIENRSPYLDTNLFNLCFSIPANLLIQKGYGKNIC